MQKTNKKLNVNPVGADASVRPHIKEMTLKKQNGITLIALIITIIVMLILVGVTINVALNGGLFEKADTATKQTQKETDQEELQIAVVAALNDDLEIPDANAIKNNLSEGWSVTGPENGVYTCISPKLNEFTVSETDKKITYAGISNGDGEPEAPDIYGIAYEATIEKNNITMYLLENGIMIQTLSAFENDFGVVKGVSINGNVLKLNEEELGVFSDDCFILTYYENQFTRNENKIYEYNPNVFDETYNIYLNAFYVSENTDNIISTFTEGLDLVGQEIGEGNYCAFADIETKGITVSEDGEQITYAGNTYTRLKK